MKSVFKKEYSENDYKDFQQNLKIERKILIQVIIIFFIFFIK